MIEVEPERGNRRSEFRSQHVHESNTYHAVGNMRLVRLLVLVGSLEPWKKDFRKGLTVHLSTPGRHSFHNR